MITELQIKNFKCWRDTGTLTLKPITGFFGANSSGKSSILQFLLMLKQTVNSLDRAQVLNFGDNERAFVRLGSFRDIIYHDGVKKQTDDLEWSFQWTLPEFYGVSNPDQEGEMLSIIDSKLKFCATVGDVFASVGHTPLIVKQFAYEYFDRYYNQPRTVGMQHLDKSQYQIVAPEFDFKPIPGQNELLPAPVKCYGFPSRIGTAYQNAEFLVGFGVFFEEQLFDRLYYLGPLREPPDRGPYIWSGSRPTDVGPRGQQVIDALLAGQIIRGDEIEPTVAENVAQQLQKLGLIHEFKIEPLVEGGALYNVLLQQTPDAAFVSLLDVGFGVSQVLPVLTLCNYVPRGSIILLEQPEIHLHPKVQADLADVLIDVSRNRNIQIILESHSEHLLARLQRRMAEYGLPGREEAISSEHVALYFCEKKAAAAEIRPLELNRFGFITNWPEDFFGDDLGERTAMMSAAMERKQKGEAA